jgi:uncharacterized membrane protein
MDIKKSVTSLIMLIIGIVIIFNIISATAGDLVNAGNNVSATTLPLASLFSGSGVVLLIFMAGVLLAIVGAVMYKKGE